MIHFFMTPSFTTHGHLTMAGVSIMVGVLIMAGVILIGEAITAILRGIAPLALGVVGEIVL
jgi:hypothetical protein